MILEFGEFGAFGDILDSTASRLSRDGDNVWTRFSQWLEVCRQRGMNLDNALHYDPYVNHT
jgi:hypothetical protein